MTTSGEMELQEMTRRNSVGKTILATTYHKIGGIGDKEILEVHFTVKVVRGCEVWCRKSGDGQ